MARCQAPGLVLPRQDMLYQTCTLAVVTTHRHVTATQHLLIYNPSCDTQMCLMTPTASARVTGLF